MKRTLKIGLALLLAGTPAAQAPDRVIGLLALPEVFGRGACDRFRPEEVELHAAPAAGALVGRIKVDEYRAFHDVGGCAGLRVSVHDAAPGQVSPLPTLEYEYEAPGAIVLQRQGSWFRVRLGEGSAWIRASQRDEFFPLERLLSDSLTYLTAAWDGRLAASPGGATRAARRPSPERDDTSVRVVGFRRVGEQLWAEVEIFSHSPCVAPEDPAVLDRGWLAAHASSGEPAVWFYSRGC